MSTHNICFRREIRKILCGYPLLSVAMFLNESYNYKMHITATDCVYFIFTNVQNYFPLYIFIILYKYCVATHWNFLYRKIFFVETNKKK